MLRDFNAKVGDKHNGFTVAKYAQDECNDRGNRFVEWTNEQGMIVGKT